MAGVMMKGLNLNFILPVLALLGAIIWIGYVVVAKNPASKEIVFSYTALISTFLMFALNLPFLHFSDCCTVRRLKKFRQLS